MAGELKAAERLMHRAFRVIHRILRRYPTLEAVREIARLRGYETGHSRGPIVPLTTEQEKQIRADLEELDFFSDPVR